MSIVKRPTRAGSFTILPIIPYTQILAKESVRDFLFIDLYSHLYLGLYNLVQFPIELGHHTIADVLGHWLFLHQMDNILHSRECIHIALELVEFALGLVAPV